MSVADIGFGAYGYGGSKLVLSETLQSQLSNTETNEGLVSAERASEGRRGRRVSGRGSQGSSVREPGGDSETASGCLEGHQSTAVMLRARTT